MTLKTNNHPLATHDLRAWSGGLGMAVLLGLGGVNSVQALVVGESGQAAYSQAIAVPPGVAGMAPQLGLLYSRGGVNGPVGHGWSVQGLSSISRCPANMATDGVRGVVAFKVSVARSHSFIPPPPDSTHVKHMGGVRRQRSMLGV